MSQHPSLKGTQKSKRHRSVLKRREKISILEKLGKWKEGNSIFGLPKVKSLRFKLKKEKAAKPTEEAAGETATGEVKPEEAKAEGKKSEEARKSKEAK